MNEIYRERNVDSGFHVQLKEDGCDSTWHSSERQLKLSVTRGVS